MFYWGKHGISLILFLMAILVCFGCSDEDTGGPLVNEDPVASFSYFADTGKPIAGIDSANVVVSYSHYSFEENLGPASLRPGDEGTNYLFTNETSENFGSFVEKLTNDTDETLNVNLYFGQFCYVISGNESYWFDPQSNGICNPDLQGATINKIECEVVAINFESPGSDPHGTGDWTDVLVELKFRIYSD